MTAGAKQKDRPPNYHVIARARQRPWQSASLRSFRERAARCAAGVTDCHVASLLAMTEVDDGWSHCAGGASVVPVAYCGTAPVPFPDDRRSQTEGPATKLPRHCEEGKARRGNPHLSGPSGTGRCKASQGLRIATAYGLAMTEVADGWSHCAGGASVVPVAYCGTAPVPFPHDPRSQTEGPATKLPRHCEPVGRGNPVDFPGCSVTHGIATSLRSSQ